MRTAVIGGGASGMGAAWSLAQAGIEVTLIEREVSLGGHLLACHVPTSDGGSVVVDVGVSDFNRATFSNVGALFDELEVEYRPICQHASFMYPDGRTAWYTNDNGINAVTPFSDQARFTAEIARFRLECVEVLDDPEARDETLQAYCDRRGYSQEFRDCYLFPRAQGSFPMPDCNPADYMIRGLAAFWRIHGLAGPGPADRNVLVGGMASYGAAFARWLTLHGGRVLTGSSVIGVSRRAQGIRVRYSDHAGKSHEEIFDHIVLGVRGEQVLPLLEDASIEEREAFGSLRWHRARVAVHRDQSLMPDRQEAWGAYNYVLTDRGIPNIRPTITFYPAKLAGLEMAAGIFVTMNPFKEPDKDKVVANYFLSHPASGPGGDLAVSRIAQFQGVRNTWYCGSYLVRPWVHEQALATGITVGDTMRLRTQGAAARTHPYLDDFLATIPLFGGLDPYAIADVRLVAERFSLAAGERIFAQGDASDGVYLISGGEVSIRTRTPGDGIVELSRVGVGGVIGEVCLLDGGVRSAEARAIAPTLGFKIDLNRFGALRSSGRPAAFEVLERLRREVANRTRRTIEGIATSAKEALTPRPTSDVQQVTSVSARRSRSLLLTFAGFDHFSESIWREFSGLVTLIEVKRGVRLEFPGLKVSSLYVVARGALRAGLLVGDQMEQLLVHGPGEIVGVAAMIDGDKWPLAIDAREDSTLLILASRDFAALRVAHSALAMQFFDMVGQQLTRDLRRMVRVLARMKVHLNSVEVTV